MKKRSRVQGRPAQAPVAFGTGTHDLEPTSVAILMHWMRNILKEKDLDLGMPKVETGGADRKRPDLVIYESRRSEQVLCVLEAKPPYFDVFHEKELKEPARQKAVKRKAKYFATTNFQWLIWWNTEKVNAGKPEEEQIVEKYRLSDVEDLNSLEETRYAHSTKKQLERFLIALYRVYTGREPEPKLPIDEFLVFRLQEKIGRLARYYRRIIDDKAHKNKTFAKALKAWFHDQGWSFAYQRSDFDKAARQAAYLLANKILFYDALQTKRPRDLDPLEIPESLTKGGRLQTTLQGFFQDVLDNIDYETIYTTDFIDTVAFPDAKEVVEEVKALVNILKRYDFGTLGYDVIGLVFQRLIPEEERHNLGQFFTRSDVVDLILSFCVKHEDDKVLDPSCGSGTFLVRAYHQKRLLNQRRAHDELLDGLWGVDVAKFPAHLATINLAICDLAVERNYPNVIHQDFFSLLVGDEGFVPDRWRKARAKTLRLKEREVIHPRWFDAVVGNPPYTRQEEIKEIAPEQADYKRKLIEAALLDVHGKKKLANIGKRAGIHAYFFVHGMKFLKEGGRFGFIVSESWLDVDYGKGLQEFFLSNCKIVAILASKVERWFAEADINTCTVILEKCADEKARDENLVRFVHLKKPLKDFIPPARDIWEAQVERKNSVERLIKTVLAHNALYENDELRIFPRSQRELWEEGYDGEAKKYTGAKWGKYLRAPEIFFKILEKGKGKLVPLKEVAEVRRGFTTGANEFFYLTKKEEKQWKIEKKYLKPVIKSPRECKSILVDPRTLKYKVFMVHRDKKDLRDTKALKYIEWGKKQKFHERPTCQARERWWDLGKRRKPDLVWIKGIWDRHFLPIAKQQAYSDQQLYEIHLNDAKGASILAASLNCTLTALFAELNARFNLGEGILWIATYEAASMPALNPKSKAVRSCAKRLDAALTKIIEDKVPAIFSKIEQPNYRALDKIVMGDILGLTDEEQLEVYRAVVDLVKSRLEKAKSVDKRKTKDGMDVEMARRSLVKGVRENADPAKKTK